MNVIVKIINYLFIGQYAAELKSDLKRGVSSFESEEHRISFIKSCLYAPMFAVFFPFFLLLAGALLALFPDILLPNRKAFAWVMALVSVVFFNFIAFPYYVNNELYKSAIEEYERLNEGERSERRRSQLFYYTLSVVSSIMMFLIILYLS
jgi:hypothetical protein